MRSKSAALALTLPASETNFSLPLPTLQAIRHWASKRWKPPRRRPQSATFLARVRAQVLRIAVSSFWNLPALHLGMRARLSSKRLRGFRK
jgi:hypothetical protein